MGSRLVSHLCREAGRTRRVLERAGGSDKVAESASDFEEPHNFVPASGLFRDSDTNLAPAFVVRDGNYISARWPGAVHRFAREFAKRLAGELRPADGASAIHTCSRRG